MRAWFSNASLTDFKHSCFSTVLCLVLSLMLQGQSLAQPFPGTTSPLGESRFLLVDQAFRFYTSIDSDSQITVHWQIAPRYYLYQDKFRFSIEPSTPVVRGQPSEARVLATQLPEGVAHHDEYFGDVSVYYQETAALLTLPPDSGRQFTLIIEFQGCAEEGLCYPPQRREIPMFL